MKKTLLILSFILLAFAGFSQTYYLVENGEITRTGLPTTYTSNDSTYWFKNYHAAGPSVWYADGFRIGVTPQYDPATQYLGISYYDVGNDYVTRQVIDKSPEQIAAEQEAYLQAIDEQLDIRKLKYVLRILAKPVLDTLTLDSTSIASFSNIYAQFRVNKHYEKDDVFVSDSTLYKVVQPHTSQADWPPATTASLYTPYRVPGAILPWDDQHLTTDPYMKGEKVTWNGSTWTSDIDNNVWEPGVYGWTIIN